MNEAFLICSNARVSCLRGHMRTETTYRIFSKFVAPYSLALSSTVKRSCEDGWKSRHFSYEHTESEQIETFICIKPRRFDPVLIHRFLDDATKLSSWKIRKPMFTAEHTMVDFPYTNTDLSSKNFLYTWSFGVCRGLCRSSEEIETDGGDNPQKKLAISDGSPSEATPTLL